MDKNVVYWERQNYSETGFTLIEILEDGTLEQRKFLKQDGDYRDQCFEEAQCETLNLNGKIIIQKVTFNSDGTLKKEALDDHVETVDSYDVSAWMEARKKVREYQKRVEDDMQIDYRSVLMLDSELIAKKLQKTDQKTFPLIPCRIKVSSETIKREKHPEQMFAIYIPMLNEVLYFHHMPKHNHISITGDQLFALDTKITDKPWDNETFLAYVYKKKHEIGNNKTYYRTLIDSQREKRAFMETETIGDLFPR